MTNLDKVVDRYNTNSLKWDFAEKRGKNKDILPLWVADMDFELPDIIIDKLKEVLNNKIFGYSEPLDDYYDAIIEWNKNHYNLDLDKKYIINGCSVVFHIATIIKALTNIGDSIIINEPVYYPFKETILANDRNVIISNLINDQNNKYTFNYDDMFKIYNDELQDVWTIPAVQMNEKKFGYHPTQKPEALLERIIKACSNDGDTVLDPFSGSGTTCYVAKKLKRNYIGIEKDKEFFNISKRRIDSI